MDKIFLFELLFPPSKEKLKIWAFAIDSSLFTFGPKLGGP